jgi:hypothetical protein
MPAPSSEVEFELVGLFVPFPAPGEAEVQGKIKEVLGIQLDAFASFLREEGRLWRESGDPGDRFADAIQQGLCLSSSKAVQFIAGDFFSLFKRFRSSGLSHAEAGNLLSQADFIFSLAEKHRMSCSSISIVLSGEEETRVPWQLVQKLLPTELRHSPDTASLLEADNAFSDWLFPDVRETELLDVLDDHIGPLLGKGNLIDALRELTPESAEEGDWSLIAMLHFALFPLDGSWHHPSFPYEFAPRGAGMNPIREAYEDLIPSENPWLNNAKGADRLDVTWSYSRAFGQRSQVGPLCLQRVLAALEELQPASRRLVARAVRAWCAALRRIHDPVEEIIPKTFGHEEARRFLDSICASESGTRGVLEQRVLDAIATAIHHDQSCRVRGRGDSVNAANLPRRKLGDCEFSEVSSGRGRVTAYEAHAGTLTQEYFEQHTRSLTRGIRRRKAEEWGPEEDWELHVIFVAHDYANCVEHEYYEEDVKVTVQFLSYEDLQSGLPDEILLPLIRSWVWERLRGAGTSQSVKSRFVELLQ